MSATARTVELRVLATTDLHMHILPYDYVTDLPSVTIGLARTAALIREARAEATNAVLFDNGDFLHGNLMSEELARSEPDAFVGPHPIVTAMTRLGYDAVTLGNHDFDHGLGYLGAVLAAAPFPVVTSNLTLTADATQGRDPRPFWTAGPALNTVPHAIIERDVTDSTGTTQRLRIGLVGFLPPHSVTGLHGEAVRAEIADIVHAADRAVPHLRARGADLVVALAHSGIGGDTHEEEMENAVVPLAAIDGIDVIVAGHAHQVFPDGPRAWSRHADPETGRIHGTPVVAPGFWGSHLGIIDLTLTQAQAGRWTMADARVEARPISVRDPTTGQSRPRVSPDPAILGMMETLHDLTLDRARRPVGETLRPIHSYFAAVAPSPALDIVLRAKRRYLAERVTGTPLEALPIVASTAPFKAGGIAGPAFYTHVPPGPITRKSLSDIYRYPNDLAALRVTGAELTEWLERAAGVFNRIVPGAGVQPLLRSSTPIYCYEVVAGVSYEIDLTEPGRYSPEGRFAHADAHRIRNLRLPGGRALDPNDEVLLITNSFRVAGGGRYPSVSRARAALDLPVPMRDVLIDYLSATGAYDEAPACTWRFAPVPGAEAVFCSAPEAAAFLDEVGDRAIRPLEIDADGFRRYALVL